MQEQDKQWRPICERYPEFMEEEWAMDALDEEQAKIDAMKLATANKIQDDKRKQREKRKVQADAKKRKRKAAAEQTTVNVAFEDDRFGPGAVANYGGVFNQPSPSPLRHATAYDPAEESVELEHSPAPKFASYGEFQGNQSGYNSETHNDDMELEQELEAFVNGGPDTPA